MINEEHNQDARGGAARGLHLSDFLTYSPILPLAMLSQEVSLSYNI